MERGSMSELDIVLSVVLKNSYTQRNISSLNFILNTMIVLFS